MERVSITARPVPRKEGSMPMMMAAEPRRATGFRTEAFFLDLEGEGKEPLTIFAVQSARADLRAML